MFKDFFNDLIFCFSGEIGIIKCFLEMGAHVGEGKLLTAIIHMAHISQGKNGFATVTFDACHRANGAGWGNGGLSSVADAVGFDALDDLVPIDGWAVPVHGIGFERGGRFPDHVFWVINAALDGWEGFFLLC